MTSKTYTAARAKRLILDGNFPEGGIVEGSLYLSGCDLSGVTLPTTIGGSLDLSGCDLSGVTLPTTIGGSLYLSGCDLSGVTGWWSDNGEATRRRCIAVSYYALIQTDTGQYIAGCRGPWTKKQALDHWGHASRKDKRAKAFVAAIELYDAAKLAA
ncbi:MAG: hypothetical protein DI569_12815 [Sphingopyxis macrogoltabida]|uniref:Pentapeptide repeat-containing protein n=1 Tax=Sphingopyxis macrogoltabida TaxID=33050 RepID=A0A2W5KVT9_SPHMC|nr:MAG: hypothetical protein DI569_12815 [Sphingopyxis macrogoltabida]